MLTWTKGIFCAIFWQKRNPFTLCQQAFCGKCFTSGEKVKFFIKTLNYESQESDGDWEDEMRLQEAWENKHRDPTAYLHARDGDHLHMTFECHICVFRKLKHRDPSSQDPTDEVLMDTIKRMISDAFGSRSESTVSTLARNVRMQISMSEQVGLQELFEQTTALPLHDHCGYEVAAGMLLYSTRPGRYSKDHL